MHEQWTLYRLLGCTISAQRRLPVNKPSVGFAPDRMHRSQRSMLLDGPHKNCPLPVPTIFSFHLLVPSFLSSFLYILFLRADLQPASKSGGSHGARDQCPATCRERDVISRCWARGAPSLQSMSFASLGKDATLQSFILIFFLQLFCSLIFICLILCFWTFLLHNFVSFSSKTR